MTQRQEPPIAAHLPCLLQTSLVVQSSLVMARQRWSFFPLLATVWAEHQPCMRQTSALVQSSLLATTQRPSTGEHRPLRLHCVDALQYLADFAVHGRNPGPTKSHAPASVHCSELRQWLALAPMHRPFFSLQRPLLTQLSDLRQSSSERAAQRESFSFQTQRPPSLHGAVQRVSSPLATDDAVANAAVVEVVGVAGVGSGCLSLQPQRQSTNVHAASRSELDLQKRSATVCFLALAEAALA